MDNILLTQFSKSSGCGCKVAPAVLQGILDNQFNNDDENVLVGVESFDDASVISISGDDCIISTADFFTPIVNDAFDFGKIAAANAISDVYAMGGKPINAISILGFPVSKIPVHIVKEIISGAQQKCSEAGIKITGGHSIDSPEPFFGLSVTGVIKKQNIKRNNSAKSGDKIYITKPLGAGIFSAAIKRNIIEPGDYISFFNNASKLNSIGEKFGNLPFIHAMTDVTGFGLLGHLCEINDGSETSAEIFLKNIPLLPNLKSYIDKSCIPDSTYRNWNSCEKKVDGITNDSFVFLNDPQTNGGLLITADSNFEDELKAIAISNNTELFYLGNIIDRNSKAIYLI